MIKDRLKFRAWNKKERIMHYKAEQTYDTYTGCPRIWKQSFSDVLSDENYIVEQCTGLKDKNGKLIYEGDIIQTPSQRFFLKVDAFNVLACVYPDCSDAFDWSMFVADIYHEGRQRFIEVIGNIHENPELMK